METAVKTMRKGKSPGVDQFSVKMIKAAGVMGLQWLHRVLNAIWSSEEVPEKWKRGSIVPRFKKGSKNKCEN